MFEPYNSCRDNCTCEPYNKKSHVWTAGLTQATVQGDVNRMIVTSTRVSLRFVSWNIFSGILLSL
jgi:hypothetical protein